MAPSNRHTQLQNMVSTWISNRSFKMCGRSEAEIGDYIADFVAIAGLWSRYHSMYAHHSGLTTMSMTSRINDAGEWERTIHGDIDRWFVCVFEVKVSRPDFLHTFGGKNSAHAKARMQPVGTAHWVVAEKGICTADELPDFWGLLTPYGAGLREVKIPKLNVLPDSSIHAIAFDMLWLTMNHRYSQYEHMNEMGKAIKKLRAAIQMDHPKSRLLQLAELARKAGRGFA